MKVDTNDVYPCIWKYWDIDDNIMEILRYEDIVVIPAGWHSPETAPCPASHTPGRCSTEDQNET